jgi:hypothetical protein
MLWQTLASNSSTRMVVDPAFDCGSENHNERSKKSAQFNYGSHRSDMNIKD